MSELTPNDISTKEGLMRSAVAILDKKLATDIKILDVEKLTSLCCYFIICTGRSNTHVESLADDLEEALTEAGTKPLHREGAKESGWIALDYASVIVHIFDDKSREFYDLEKLWRDGIKISPEQVIG